VTIVGSEREQLKGLKVRAVVKYGLNETMERELFLRINMAVPCPGMYLHPEKESVILNDLKHYIYFKFGHQVSNSVRCTSPNINIELFLNSISYKREDDTSPIGDWFGDGTVIDSDSLNKELLGLNKHIGNVLNGERGFEAYKINCPRRSNKHDITTFQKLLVIVKKKAVNGIPCYLGFIDNNRIVACMFNRSKLI
jgi:hypothetical protein